MSQELLEELANAVAAKIAETKAAAVVVDLPERRVRVTESGTMYEVYLGNAYEEYAAASPDERPAIVTKYARIADSQEDIAPPTADDWQRLLPKVNPRRERELLRLRFGEITNVLEGIALTDGVSLQLAIDREESIRMVSASDLASANMSEAEGFELARRNLLARSKEPWQPIVPGLFQSPWGDYFDGSRLALPTLVARIGVQGDPIVTLPNRCAMLVTGSREPVGLTALYTATRSLAQADRPLYLGALRLVDGTWRPLGNDDIDVVQLTQKILLLDSLQEALDYQAVGERVREAIAELGYHVEPLQVTEVSEGITMTFTHLPRAANVVIPKADMIICNEAMFAWHKLETMLGRNLAPLDVWPPHFAVRRAPTLVEIANARIK